MLISCCANSPGPLYTKAASWYWRRMTLDGAIEYALGVRLRTTTPTSHAGDKLVQRTSAASYGWEGRHTRNRKKVECLPGPAADNNAQDDGNNQ